ncbi:HNH endonuclease [Haladaptatus litoreus]|uniref:HNH endonuclease n=1 Tax=Haladaptatus litoreus TaxID=553468 RepID=A0A1N7EJD5_9EURY|nr:HNH endonuclease [Haladaptatus litoreus]SIR88139.1 HNH endonuclease [Haladaptatus litoreus]
MDEMNTEDGDRISVGTEVIDRAKDGQAPAVVIRQPDAVCEEWDVPGTGKTVADFNPEYEPDAVVSIVAFKGQLEEKVPDWDSRPADELWGVAKNAGVRRYAYPEPRLCRRSGGLPETIQTYHQLICYQHARLIQLATGIDDNSFLWSKYEELRDGEIRMSSITKEDKYQLQEDYGTCIYCGEEGKTTFDHVIPLSNGGADTISNQVPACKSCNSSKGSKDVIEWHQELDEPVSRVVWGKYIKQYKSILADEGRLKDELTPEDRDKWDGVKIKRNVLERIKERSR